MKNRTSYKGLHSSETCFEQFQNKNFLDVNYFEKTKFKLLRENIVVIS